MDGQYDPSGDPKQLHLHMRVSGPVRCPGKMQLEKACLAALAHTDGQTIEGHVLVLRRTAHALNSDPLRPIP